MLWPFSTGAPVDAPTSGRTRVPHGSRHTLAPLLETHGATTRVRSRTPGTAVTHVWVRRGLSFAVSWTVTLDPGVPTRSLPDTPRRSAETEVREVSLSVNRVRDGVSPSSPGGPRALLRLDESPSGRPVRGPLLHGVHLVGDWGLKTCAPLTPGLVSGRRLLCAGCVCAVAVCARRAWSVVPTHEVGGRQGGRPPPNLSCT